MTLTRDEAGFLQVLQTHKGIIYKVVRAYEKDDESRKDLLQEIILQLWRSFSSYDQRYALTTWIYRIALNVCISAYRRERRRAGINLEWKEDVMYLADESLTSEMQDKVEELYQAIHDLRELDRALILLYLDGFSQQEMANVMGLSVTNVSTRIGRIKQQLLIKLTHL